MLISAWNLVSSNLKRLLLKGNFEKSKRLHTMNFLISLEAKYLLVVFSSSLL